MHLGNDSAWIHELYVTFFKTRFKNLIADHRKIETCCLPYSIHDFEKLQDQIVLSQIVTRFPHDPLLISLYFLFYKDSLFIYRIPWNDLDLIIRISQSIRVLGLECCLRFFLSCKIANYHQRSLFRSEDFATFVCEFCNWFLRCKRKV